MPTYDHGVAGLTGTIGVTVLNADGTAHDARATAGITEPVAGSGIYHIAHPHPGTLLLFIFDGGVGTVGGSCFDDGLTTMPARAGDAMALTAAYDKAKDDVLTPLATVDGKADTLLARATEARLAELDAANLPAGVAATLKAADYTAPDNASIAAILVDTGTAIPATLAAIASDAQTAAGADFGEDECTLTLTDTLGTVLSDAQVYVFSGAARSRTKTTDSLGQVVFDLTDGETYNLWVTHDRYSGTNPTAFVAVKDV